MKILQPDLILDGNVLSLTVDRLKSYGIQGVVLDIDDTIVPIRTADVSPELQAWIAEIRQNCKLWLVTNNPQRQRIEAIAHCLGLPFILSAGKPSTKKLRQAVEEMALPYPQVAMVGDRVFTDVLGGNRLGLFTILARPISAGETSSSFQLLRQVEFGLARLAGVSLAATEYSNM
jgi:uncharacterized protein